jgi:hypothetical protein
MASDEMRARAMAIWAAAFVGLLPLGALITAGLAAWLGAGGAVLVDALVMLVGGIVVMALRPELAWLGLLRAARSLPRGDLPRRRCGRGSARSPCKHTLSRDG